MRNRLHTMELSTRIGGLLAAATVLAASLVSAATNWPLREAIDLSSGFGDYRPGHFHFGIDLRTGGTIGRRVHAPVDGCVMRARTSYFGYGKALYLKGDDGYIYVFGHLSDFAPEVDRAVKAAQVAARRYYQDLYFPDDSIRVKEGGVVAYTGQTGAGAPHLHFEKRTADNVPINPLRHGFSLRDMIKPVFTRVGFQMVDDSSLFDIGRRKMFFSISTGQSAGQYRLDTVLYFNRPFGIIVDCFDRMRDGGMKQAVYRLSCYVDDRLTYQVVFDSLDFGTTSSVSLEYDYLEAVDDRESARTLFSKVGNAYSGSNSVHSGGGIFGTEVINAMPSIGLHRVKIVAEDCFDNKSELTFKFLWGPPGSVYTLDSTVATPPDTTRFYFSPVAGWDQMDIDSVQVYLNRGDRWGIPTRSRVERFADGRLLCEVVANRVQPAVLRLFLFAESGCLIRDNLFNGLVERGPGNFQIEHEITEDGLLVTVRSTNRGGYQARLELYYQDSLLGIEYPRYFNMTEYTCFIPPQWKYRRVDRLAAVMSVDTSYNVRRSDTVSIFAVGFDTNEEIAIDEYLRLHLSADKFYEPRYVEVHKTPLIRRSILGLNSAYYRILPEAFVCRDAFDVSLKIPPTNVHIDRSGICWLDEDEDRWVWLDSNKTIDSVLWAQSIGGGGFAAVLDLDPPRLKYLSVADGRTYQSRRPAIYFVIEDTLSGIGSDESIVIEIDGQWLIPEYDVETGRCTSKPLEPLEPGRHHLGIRVTDRAGNLAEQYLNFYVKKSGRK